MIGTNTPSGCKREQRSSMNHGRVTHSNNPSSIHSSFSGVVMTLLLSFVSFAAWGQCTLSLTDAPDNDLINTAPILGAPAVSLQSLLLTGQNNSANTTLTFGGCAGVTLYESDQFGNILPDRLVDCTNETIWVVADDDGITDANTSMRIEIDLILDDTERPQRTSHTNAATSPFVSGGNNQNFDFTAYTTSLNPSQPQTVNCNSASNMNRVIAQSLLDSWHVAGFFDDFYDDNCTTDADLVYTIHPTRGPNNNGINFNQMGACGGTLQIHLIATDQAGNDNQDNNANRIRLDIDVVDLIPPVWLDYNSVVLQAGLPTNNGLTYNASNNTLEVTINSSTGVCNTPGLNDWLDMTMFTPMADDCSAAGSVDITPTDKDPNTAGTQDTEVVQNFTDAPTANCRIYRAERSWTSEDGCGNTNLADSFNLVINVFDMEAPQMTADNYVNYLAPRAPDSLNQATLAGDCFFDFTGTTTLEVNYIDCSSITYAYTISILSGTTQADFEALNGAGSLTGTTNNPDLIYPVGVYQIDYTATDECNQTSTAFVGKLTVDDGNAPIIVTNCPVNINTVLDPTLCTTQEIHFAPPTGMDECSVTRTVMATNSVTITENNATDHSAFFPSGTTTVTYTFTDPSMNDTPCSFDVVVSAPASVAPSVDCSNITPADIYAIGGCANQLLLNYVGDAVVTGSCPSLYTTTQDPAPGTNIATLNGNGTYHFDDNPGGGINSGDRIRVYIDVTDGTNLTSCFFDIDVIASPTGPIVPYVANLPAIDVDCNSIVIEAPLATNCNTGCTQYAFPSNTNGYIFNPGVEAGDPCNPFEVGDVAPSYTFFYDPATVNNLLTIIWEYNIEGLSGSQNQMVTINGNDMVQPTISCPSSITVMTSDDSDDGSSDCRVTPNSVTPNQPDNIGIYSSTIPAGVLNATGTAADNCHVYELSYQIIAADGTVLVARASTTAHTTFVDAGNFAYPLGANTVTYWATDAAGLEVSCAVTVTVVDDEAPTFISCGPNRTLFIGQQNGTPALGTADQTLGDCAYTLGTTDTSLDPVLRDCDNQAVVTYTVASTEGTITPAATNSLAGASINVTDPDGDATFVVTWTFNDGTGNITCTQTLTVIDDAAPTIDCSAIDEDAATVGVQATRGISDDNDETNCNYIIQGSEFDPSSVDDCNGTLTLTHNLAGAVSPNTLAGSTLPIGTTSIQWTVTDVQGNAAVCSIAITIEDNQGPAVLTNACPANIMIDALNGNCDQLIGFSNAWIRPSVNDFSDCNGGIATLTEVIDDATVQASIDLNYPYNPNIVGFMPQATFPVGTTTVTYEATDNNSNTASCSFTVTVVDNQAPTIACSGDQMLGTTCPTGVVPDYRQLALVNDNCSVNNTGVANPSQPGFTVTQSPAPGTTLQTLVNNGTLPSTNDGQTFTVTLVVNDSNGTGTDNCTFDVELDGSNTAPIPNAGTAGGQLPTISSLACGGDYTYAAPTATDVCGGANIIGVLQPNNPLPAGITLNANNTYTFTPGIYFVTWQYTSNGVTSSQGQQFNILEDVTPPNAQCRTFVGIDLNALGQATLASSMVDNNSTDNCNIVQYALSQTSFDCSDVGNNNTVTLTVTDDNGLTSTCNSILIVRDNRVPVFTAPTCPNNQTINLTTDAAGNTGDCTATRTWTHPTVLDNCSIVRSEITFTGPPNTASFTPNTLITREFDLGTTLVTYEVEDTGGNIANCNYIVNVTDNELPTFTCGTYATTTSADGTMGDCNFVMQGTGFDPTNVMDNCGAVTVSHDYVNVSPISSNSLAGASFTAGTTVVTWTFMDNNGLTATCTSSIKISDDEAPTASCLNGLNFALSPTGTVTLPASIINGNSFDNCPNSNLSFAYDLNGTASRIFDCADVGLVPISLYVTDEDGNSNFCTTNIEIQDNTDPVAICQNATVSLGTNGLLTLAPSVIDNGSSDACGIASRTVSPNAFNCNNLGTSTVTLTITDSNGRTDNCTSQVTVQDNTNPTASCQNASVQLNALGAASVAVADINNGSSDACGLQSTTISPSNFDCSNVGNNTVTLTATDNNGNVSTCTAVVAVTQANPIVFCQNRVVQLDQNNNFQATVFASAAGGADFIDNGSTGVCPGVTIANYQIARDMDGDGTADLPFGNFVTFGQTDVGAQQVILRVTDSAGGIATCSATVTVQPMAIIFTAGNVVGPTGGMVNIPITVENFINVVSFGIQVDVADASVAEIVSVEAVAPLTDAELQVGLNTANNTTIITFTSNQINPITLSDDDVILNVKVNLVGNPNDLSDVDVVGIPNNNGGVIEVGQVFGGNGNSFDGLGGATGSVLIDNSIAILPLIGNVSTDEGTGIQNVTIEIYNQANNDLMTTTLTDANGDFSVNIPSGTTVRVVPRAVNVSFLDDPSTPFIDESREFWLNGVTTFDAAVIQGHIAEISNFILTTPMELLAADVNGNGTAGSCAPPNSPIEIGDAVAIKAFIAELRDDFPGGTPSWQFVDASHVFTDPDCPWNPLPADESIIVTVGSNTPSTNFTGIKIGDVRPTSAAPILLTGEDDGSENGTSLEIDERNNQTLNFTVDDISLAAGEQYTIPFFANNFLDMVSMQFSLEFDTDVMQVEEVVAGDFPGMSAANFGTKHLDMGYLGVGWYDAYAVSLAARTPIFYVTFTALEDMEVISESISLTASILKKEAVNLNFEEHDVDLIFNSVNSTNQVVNKPFELYNNRPNPFKDATIISFNLDTASPMTLEILDVTGQVIKTYQRDFTKGYHEMNVDASDLAGGILYYRLSTERHTATRKMILMK